MRVVDHQEMLEVEKLAFDEFGLTVPIIIENVGRSVANFIEDEYLLPPERIEERDRPYFDHAFGEIVFLVGKGNNGADALSASRHLVNRGHKCRALILFPDETTSEAMTNQRALAERFGVRVNEIRKNETIESFFNEAGEKFLMIDGILGTGFNPPLSQYLFEIMNLVNEFSTVTISIDLPSGITSERGAMGATAIKADHTLAIGLPKTGCYISEGAKHVGEVSIINAGFPRKILKSGGKELLVPDESIEIIESVFRPRNKFAHKNTFGHTLVVGGNTGMSGAPLMSSLAALKVGTGLVTVATWRHSYLELTSRLTPEVMANLIPESDEQREYILENLDRFDSLVIGPGLGRGKKSRDIVLWLLQVFNGPIVLDADAINVLDLEKDAEHISKRNGITVMTPHLGEFAHLIGLEVKDVEERPIHYVKEVMDKVNSAIILKGPCSYIGLPKGPVYLNYFPNDGMASGGSGDVLAGILGGLLAQNAPRDQKAKIFEDSKFYEHSICVGVMIHTLSGRFAREKHGVRSMSAMNLIDHFSAAIRELKQKMKHVRVEK